MVNSILLHAAPIWDKIDENGVIHSFKSIVLMVNDHKDQQHLASTGNGRDNTYRYVDQRKVLDK